MFVRCRTPADVLRFLLPPQAIRGLSVLHEQRQHACGLVVWQHKQASIMHSRHASTDVYITSTL